MMKSDAIFINIAELIIFLMKKKKKNILRTPIYAIDYLIYVHKFFNYLIEVASSDFYLIENRKKKQFVSYFSYIKREFNIIPQITKWKLCKIAQ